MILFPKYIQIETSVVCNSKCVFCPHEEMERGPNYMEDWVWKKIIDESRGKGIIYRPFMINEPLIDPRMPEIVRYIKEDPTAKVEFNSNGNLAVKTDVEALIASNIDWVRFSLDGHTAESFKASGRGGKFEKIVENIHRFIDERNRQKSDTFIEVRIIDLDENRHEHKDFVEYWSKFVNKATVTPLYDWPWTGQNEPHRAPCLKISDEMFFMTDGNATLCCWDAFGRGIVGNVTQNTVEEIWLGETNQKYREYLSRGERDKILLCSKCDAYKNYDFSNWAGY